jgi:glucose-6-phosphate isomerase
VTDVSTAEPLTQRDSWKALEHHRDAVRDSHLRMLFETDPGRGERMVADGAGLHLDYSKNRIVDETIELLITLADDRGMPASASMSRRTARCSTSRSGCPGTGR